MGVATPLKFAFQHPEFHHPCTDLNIQINSICMTLKPPGKYSEAADKTP